MAGFCTKCGRPLPESGVCPCTMQQPQYQQQSQYQQPQYQQPQYQQQYQQPQYQQPAAPQQPSAFGLAMKNLPKLWLAYFKNPIGATRKAVEQKDFLSGIILAVITYISVFFATLVYVLRIGVHFPVGAWLVGSLMMPGVCLRLYASGLLPAVQGRQGTGEL